MKPGIRDVARHAGVSIATVSHVLNGTRFVKPETRDKVLASIAVLEYNPDVAARSLKTGKKYLIAFVVPDISNPFFSTLIETIENILLEHNYKLLIINTKETKKREIDHLRTISGYVDGLIIASTLTSYDEIKKIIPRTTPVVLVDRTITNHPFDTVLVNNYEAVYDGTLYLIGQRHKRIGYITGLSRLSTTQERLRAYKDAMHKMNLDTNDLILTGDSMYHSAPQLVDTLLSRNCTALITSNNLMAVDACMRLYEHGLQPGIDIQILGFKDSEHDHYRFRYMHGISQPTRSLGRIAAERILERIKTPSLPLREVVLSSTFTPCSLKPSGIDHHQERLDTHYE